MRRIVAVVAFFTALASAAAPCRASGFASAPEPRVTVTSSGSAGGVRAFRLRVTAGMPVMVVVPDDATLATLSINGVVRERTGRDVPVGTAPFGRGAATFTLAGTGPADRVVVAVTGSDAPLRFTYDVPLVSEARAIGFADGAVDALLLTVSIFLFVGVLALRDPTIGWYLGFALSLLGIAVARQASFPFGEAGNTVGLLACSTVAGIFIVGFCASYLRLRSDAPTLLRAALFWTVAPTLFVAVYVVASHGRADVEWLAIPNLVFLGALNVIAGLRRRSGYKPATYLGLGLLGITAMLAAKLVRDAAGLPSPFFDRWGFELAAVFDVFAFSRGIMYRYRYLLREREALESDLSAATRAARHDHLTGLLNRRGLDVRFAELGPADSTVFFVDLDDFKLVNDLGGHVAGDDALRIVGRILRHAVRSGDIVARLGGDEFVVVLVDCVDPATVLEAVARITSAVALFAPLGPESDARIGVSIGRARTSAGASFEAALTAADADAYRIKAEHHAAARALAPRLEGRFGLSPAGKAERDR